MNRPTPHRALGLLAAGRAVTFTLAWILAPAAQPGYQPLRDDLSAMEALTATQPWIMISGDLSLAAGIAALALAVGTTLRGLDTTVAGTLLFTAAAGITVQALAREDCNTALAECIAREHAGQVSWHHHVHSPAAALSFLAVLAAPLVLARPLREQLHRPVLAVYSIATASGGTLALIATMVVPQAYNGLTQRIFASIPVAWILVLAVQLNPGQLNPDPRPVMSQDIGDRSA
ncbi:DUF998 domain-containing protein [Kribbella pittospori]|uniref:DUF998 domain-containing protein n=1 Tax=Kribbella pittospori TaxID=722689 RepID=A0A4R0JJE4_9ACTN|nr:DUF998 domain-containing protein [Kribbella pittospori]TCC44828.1 DUF998 domain-containing protein [Kribbella pittospori]